MKHSSLYAIFLFIFLTSVFEASAQKEVSVYPQPDSPLQLSNVVPKWRISKDSEGQNLNMLIVEFISQNVSNKTIRAFTIRQFEGAFDSDKGLTSFRYAPTALGLLSPNQLRYEDVGEIGFSKMPQTIKLAVDFVEFNDGSTWGIDLSGSSELLVGVRVGEEMAFGYLKKVSRENGIEAVIKALDAIIDVLPPENKSGNWKRGFKIGINAKRNQIKRVYEKESIKALEAELSKAPL